MAKRKTPVKTEQKTPQTLLCTPGTFFVFTKRLVHVEVLSDTETARLWDKLTLAEGCVFMDVSVAREQVLRQIFGQDAEGFLPANREACQYLSEHYEGPMKEMVQGLAACILTGTPFGPDDRNPGIDGNGEKVPVGPKPVDSGPASAPLNEMDPELYLNAAKRTLSEITGQPVNIEFA